MLDGAALVRAEQRVADGATADVAAAAEAARIDVNGEVLMPALADTRRSAELDTIEGACGDDCRWARSST